MSVANYLSVMLVTLQLVATTGGTVLCHRLNSPCLSYCKFRQDILKIFSCHPFHIRVAFLFLIILIPLKKKEKVTSRFHQDVIQLGLLLLGRTVFINRNFVPSMLGVL